MIRLAVVPASVIPRSCRKVKITVRRQPLDLIVGFKGPVAVLRVVEPTGDKNRWLYVLQEPRRIPVFPKVVIVRMGDHAVPERQSVTKEI